MQVITVDEKSLQLASDQNFQANQAIDTYHDHPHGDGLCTISIKLSLRINDAGVVSKSYPSFWDDMQLAGYQLSEK